ISNCGIGYSVDAIKKGGWDKSVFIREKYELKLVHITRYGNILRFSLVLFVSIIHYFTFVPASFLTSFPSLGLKLFKHLAFCFAASRTECAFFFINDL